MFSMIDTGEVHALSHHGGCERIIRTWRQTREGGRVRWADEYLHIAPDMAEVEELIATSPHVLGNMPSKDADIKFVRPPWEPWPFCFLFWRYADENGVMPHFDDWWAWLVNGEGRPFWAKPTIDFAKAHGIGREQTAAAMHWRLGTAWQSHVREAHFIAAMRLRGVPIAFHPLADVVLAVDGWLDGHLFRLFVDSRYQDYIPKPLDHFTKGVWRSHDVLIPHQGFGRLWLVPDDALDALATTLDKERLVC